MRLSLNVIHRDGVSRPHRIEFVDPVNADNANIDTLFPEEFSIVNAV